MIRVVTYLQERWVLFLILIVFVVLKLPHLQYAFYWDESWPYASAIKHMYEHGASLSPAALDPELSRGHPLLFHFLVVIWMNIFGTSNVVMHSFSLFISLCLLFAIYNMVRQLFNAQTAIAAVLCISFQQIYFIQSSFVLAEILLAFLCIITVWFYIHQKYLLTAICLSLVLFTKESGLVLGLVLGLDAFIKLFDKKLVWKDKIYRLTALLVPAVLIGIFFVWQYKIRGWYLFPGHTSLLKTQWGFFYDEFRACIKVYFRDDFRKYFYAVFMLIITAAAVSKKDWRLLMSLLLVPFTVLLCSDVYHNILPRWVNVIGWIILFPFTIRSMLVAMNVRTGKAYDFIMLNVFFVIGFTIFSAINFLTSRYLIASLVPTLIIAAIYLVYCIQQLQPRLFYPAMGLVLIIEGYAYFKSDSVTDVSIGAFDGLYVQQSVIDYIEKENNQNRRIGVYDNLVKLQLEDFYTGLRKDRRPYTNVIWGTDPFTEIVIIESMEDPVAAKERSSIMKNDAAYRLAFHAEKGTAWAEVYERK